MHNLTQASIPLRLFGAVLALTLIAAVAVTITLTAAPTQAQSELPGNTPALLNVYTNPQPCGEGPDTLAAADMSEPHERTTGHYALFDTYWEKTASDPGESTDTDPANTGILHTNTCPPYVSQTLEPDPDAEEGEDKITVTKYSESGVDIDELIIHVTDLRKVAVVATEAEATAGQLSLERYQGLREALGLFGPNDEKLPVPAGTEVWWLRTDDPSTADVDESAVDDPGTTEDETATEHSNGLSLGFTTWRLDGQDWARRDGDGNLVNDTPLRYAFELERERGIPLSAEAHLLSYRVDPEDRDAARKEIWNSAAVHTKPLDMEPGQFESFEWIFTDAGTYEISVHLIGWVNHVKPADAGGDWKAISAKVTESSEVKAYTIQVGDELLENEPPVFGANRAVTENSPAGTLVGAPIPIYEGEADTFYYSLSGEGHEQFAVEAIADPHSVQIKVADGADLDYETKPSYQLTLSVTDRIDHESNHDLSTDDTLAVRIALEDEEPSVTLSATPGVDLVVGQKSRLDATLDTSDIPNGQTPQLTWYSKGENEADWSGPLSVLGQIWRHSHANIHPHSHPGSESFKAKMTWGTGSVWSNVITLTWREAE